MNKQDIFDNLIETIAKEQKMHKDKARLELAEYYRGLRCHGIEQEKLHGIMRKAYAHQKTWSGFRRQMSFYLIDYKNGKHLPNYNENKYD